jgi:hypothetical protein
MKKATSPFSTLLFVAGTNKEASHEEVAIQEKRDGISLASLLKRGSDHAVKTAKCEQSVYTEETADIWKLVDSVIETEANKHNEATGDIDASEVSDTDRNDDEITHSSSNYNKSLEQSSAIALKRRVHHRSTFDYEFKKREQERRFARETAAELVRQRNSQRHSSRIACNKDSDLCRQSHHRSPNVRKIQHSHMVHDVNSQ